jgi:hypothetical protein
MRAIGRSAIAAAASVLGAASALAQPLPAPPYQSADPAAIAAPSQGSQSLDRYGGGYARPYPIARQPGAAGGAAPRAGPYLAWAGKTEVAAASVPAAESGGWSNMTGRWDAQAQRASQPQPPLRPPSQGAPQAQRPMTPEMQAEQMGPPTGGWRPYRPQNTAPPPAPTSIYDAPAQTQAAQTQPAAPPPPQPYRQAQANAAPNTQGGPRFYSLHRDYGIQPDPIPLPPQFFGPTADLSNTPTDPLAKRTTIVNGQAKTVNVPDDQGAQ